METLSYKGFLGSVEISRSDNRYVIYGKILFINDLVTYETEDLQQIETEFQAAVDDYIETCSTLGIEAHKSFNGSFNVRIGPETHQRLAWFATKNRKKINAVVRNAVEDYLNRQNKTTSEVHNHYYMVYKSFDYPTVEDDNDMDLSSKITYKTEARFN